MATGESSDTAYPGVESHDWRGGPLLRREVSPVCLRVLIPWIVLPVADVVLGRVVVSPVYLPEPGTVKVHRDGRFFGRVTNPVNALLVRQNCRDSVFPFPLDPPELLQAGVIGHRAVIEALVSFFEDGSHDATEGSP
jgi:hypothetical protein